MLAPGECGSGDGKWQILPDPHLVDRSMGPDWYLFLTGNVRPGKPSFLSWKQWLLNRFLCRLNRQIARVSIAEKKRVLVLTGNAFKGEWVQEYYKDQQQFISLKTWGLWPKLKYEVATSRTRAVWCGCSSWNWYGRVSLAGHPFFIMPPQRYVGVSSRSEAIYHVAPWGLWS